MRLVNAKIYEEQIKKKMWECWYDEKYQYYFGGHWRYDFSLSHNSDDYLKRAFAVLDSAGELIGYISYSVDTELRVAQWFGTINFSDNRLEFGLALRQVIEDCFLKFGCEVVEWHVICGNPIERSYDKMCKRMGGRIVGITRRRALDMAGNVHDTKIYEILREDFLKARASKREAGNDD